MTLCDKHCDCDKNCDYNRNCDNKAIFFYLFKKKQHYNFCFLTYHYSKRIVVFFLSPNSDTAGNGTMS